ncbi:MAG: T9SS type A sorting domain-containing protein, partial [Bacteroidota bacterium]
AYTSVNSSVTAPSSNNRFENNAITKVLYGIYMGGSSKSRPDVNNKFIQNQLGDATSSISMMGIYTRYHEGDTVSANSVENINFAFTNTYQPSGGICLELCKYAFISANKISNWRSTLGDTRLTGLYVDGGEDGYSGPVLPTNNTIVNNFIGNGYSSSANTWNVDGLVLFNGNGDKVYYNTVSLTGALLKTDGSVTAFRSGDYNLQNTDIRNNIFHVNGSSTLPAVFMSHVSYGDYSSGGSTSDYNLLSCTASGSAMAFIGEYYGNAIQNLADWQSMTGQDANSRSANVSFVSASDLHVAGTSIGDFANLSGTPLAGFITDIDGQPRHSTPYMGADENTANPLPVKLTTFDGIADAGNVLLNWTTVSENNNKGFAVERSTDNKEFNEIAFVKGKNNNAKSEYRFNDVNAFAHAPVLYYRLKQVDNNGTYEYSKSIRLSKEEKAGGAEIVTYPNPFVKDVFVQFESNGASTIKVTLSDITGRVISSSNHEAADGKNNIRVISNDALQAGIYFLTIETNSGKDVIKLIRQ